MEKFHKPRINRFKVLRLITDTRLLEMMSIYIRKEKEKLHTHRPNVKQRNIFINPELTVSKCYDLTQTVAYQIECISTYTRRTVNIFIGQMLNKGKIS